LHGGGRWRRSSGGCVARGCAAGSGGGDTAVFDFSVVGGDITATFLNLRIRLVRIFLSLLQVINVSSLSFKSVLPSRFPAPPPPPLARSPLPATTHDHTMIGLVGVLRCVGGSLVDPAGSFRLTVVDCARLAAASKGCLSIVAANSCWREALAAGFKTRSLSRST